MRKKYLLIFFVALLLCCQASRFSYAEVKDSLFCGEISSDAINVRADATVTAEIICILSRGDVVEVMKESYDWYKIRLPKNAAGFVKKELFLKTGDKSAQALGENINLRLGPTESAPVIGRINKDEIVEITEDKGDWFRVSAPHNSFGWIHKKFVNKVSVAVSAKRLPDVVLPAQKPAEIIAENGVITVDGIVEPYGKIFKRRGTHKLVTADNKVYLLKSNSENLNSLTYHKVKVTGKTGILKKEKFPLIEILKMEILN